MNEATCFHIPELAELFDIPSEQLAPVGPNHPGYAVSIDGRIFSTRGNAPRELSSWSKGSGGYHRISLRCADGASRTRLVHRLVALAFLEPPKPRQTLVRHLDGNPDNNHADNLAWGDHADNYADSVRHGTARAARGEEHGRAKLTRANVKKLRKLLEDPRAKWTYAALGREFGVSATTIANAMKGETWCHLPLAQSCDEGGA